MSRSGPFTSSSPQSARELSEVVGVSARLNVLELGHFEQVAVRLQLLMRLVEILHGDVIVGHGRRARMTSRIAQGERLRRLTQIIILRANFLLGLDAVVVGHDVADGSTRAVRLAIWVRLLGQHHGLVSRVELEARQGSSSRAAERSLRSARGRPRVRQGQLVGGPEILLVVGHF